MLCDSQEDTPDYINVEGTFLWTFPLKTDDSKKVTLYTLKFGKSYELLNSEDCQSLGADSSFEVTLANKACL